MIRDPMKTLDYTIRFVTPAFLGNAEQAGQWRSPPFKALLRQWWRVAYAAEKQFQVDPAAMRKEEGLLFGHAWLEDDRDEKGNKVPARRSQVRIRLSKWNIGDLKQAPAIGRVAMGKKDRKSTRLNSSHVAISYAVFCLKKKKDSTSALRIVV